MTSRDAIVLEIQKLAYKLYLQRCREGKPGSAEEDWLKACELIENDQRPAGAPSPEPNREMSGQLQN